MQKIINSLNTCDLLLCSGNSIMSKTIIAFNKAQKYKEMREEGFSHTSIMEELKCDRALQFSHVALCARVSWEEIQANRWQPDFPNGAGLYVFESTTGNTDWSGISGVQINRFSLWLSKYDGDVWGRMFPMIPQADNETILDDMIGMTGLSYENGIPGLFELAMTFNDDVESDTPELHCTEGGVIILKEHGICKPDTNEHKHPPCYFGEGGRFEDSLECEIGALILLKAGKK